MALAWLTEVYRGTWVIAYRELLRLFRERSRWATSLGMPILFLIVFGAGFNRSIGTLMPGVDFVRFLYPGILAMTVIMTAIFSGLSVMWDREFGFLREVLVAPLSRTGVALGKVLGSALVALLQALVMLALTPLLGLRMGPLTVLQVLGLLALLSLFPAGLGILVASRLRSLQGFHLVMQMLLFPLIFLSGVFFPVNNVPAWLMALVKVNPLTYGVDAVRQAFLGQGAVALASPSESLSPVVGVQVLGHTTTLAVDALVMGVGGGVMLALAVASFRRQG